MEHPKRSRDEFENESFESFSDGKRQRKDPADELVANVCGDIQSLDPRNIEDVAYISNPIVVEFEKIDKLRVSFLNTIYAMIIEQPSKINVIAELVLICNAKNFVVGKYVIEFIHSKAQSLLNKVNPESQTSESGNLLDEFSGIFNNLKLILKFLSILTPIIENYSIINLYQQFLNLAIDLQNKTPDVRNGTAQQIYYGCLVSIPYLLGYENTPELLEKMNELVELAEKFVIVNDNTQLLAPFENKASKQKTIEAKILVDLVLPAIKQVQGEDKSWQSLNNKLFGGRSELLNPIVEEALANNPLSKTLVKYPLPQFSIPELEQLSKYDPSSTVDSLWTKQSRLFFQVYNVTTDFETVPKIDTYSGIFFQDIIMDIISNLSFNKQEAGMLVYNMDLAFSKDLAPVSTSIDQLTLINKDNLSGENNPPLSTWKTEDLIVENVINMMFELPKSLNREIYYYCILAVICQQSPPNVAPVFGRAIRYLYNNLETLDFELRARFIDWMSFQLSNFEFSWKWDEWVEDSQKYQQLKFHPKKNFIKNLIAKEVRLSNKKRIKESFVTLDPETSDIIPIDEYFQYLDVSINTDKQFVESYDSELYGNDESTIEVLKKLYEEKAQQLEQKQIVSAQDGIIFNFSSTDLPLHEVSSKAYELVVANRKPNNEFEELYNDVLNTAKEQFPHIDGERFLINLIFQTYSYVGSRSIYSVISLLSRDINKLKYLSGSEIKYEEDEIKFTEQELSEENIKQRQQHIIDSIARIWNHQPQVIFLTLEYLAEVEIISSSAVVDHYLNLKDSLVIANLSCLDSLHRIVSQDLSLVSQVLQRSVDNLNEIGKTLNLDASQSVEIDDNIEDPQTVDNQWLFYEYKGLLKSFYRLFASKDITDQTKGILGLIENIPTKDEVLSWI